MDSKYTSFESIAPRNEELNMSNYHRRCLLSLGVIYFDNVLFFMEESWQVVQYAIKLPWG